MAQLGWIERNTSDVEVGRSNRLGGAKEFSIIRILANPLLLGITTIRR
jgi:hypothetical protein